MRSPLKQRFSLFWLRCFVDASKSSQRRAALQAKGEFESAASRSSNHSCFRKRPVLHCSSSKWPVLAETRTCKGLCGESQCTSQKIRSDQLLSTFGRAQIAKQTRIETPVKQTPLNEFYAWHLNLTTWLSRCIAQHIVLHVSAYSETAQQISLNPQPTASASPTIPFAPTLESFPAANTRSAVTASTKHKKASLWPVR